MNLFQGTVGRKIEIVGVGLHSGKLVSLEILPSQPNSGIKFVRTDLENSSPIHAHPKEVYATNLCTCLGDEIVNIATVEHLMAAFAGLGIDNAIVKINASEIPILDGSSAPFVDRILDAGVQIQPEKRKVIKLACSFEVTHGDQYMRFEPWPEGSKSDTQLIQSAIDFANSSAIGMQSLDFEFSSENFMKLCEARTFCHIDDVNYMRSKGLALGGSLDNAIVVNSQSVLNNDGLRYPDEFVRHKILDCIGDLALLGAFLPGKITCYKAGHYLHTQFTKRALELSVESHLYNSRPHYLVSVN